MLAADRLTAGLSRRVRYFCTVSSGAFAAECEHDCPVLDRVGLVEHGPGGDRV